MGSFSIWHWLVVGLLVMLLFGKGRFSDMMGDVAKGIKSFKKGLAEDDEPKPAPRIEAPTAQTTIEAEKHADKQG
ncbi:MAG: twin-arginine translocase TatA/TatE family subunit [Alphaproteobacteria bacterium]|jgi:sec-independent protein translocase protein TatA|nr:twin-arginine translocase TatA/TatE family subunit [Alphaproteobacteria bacterium]